MKEEYDIDKLDPRKNPYTKMPKKLITININIEAIQYFKDQAQETGIPYQTLINLYLTDCAKSGRKINLSWD